MPLRYVTPAARYPADPRAVFVLSLCIVAGLPLLFGAVQPGSLESLMPGWVVLVWGMALVAGSVVTLAGMSQQSVAGIYAEQVGSVAVGAATIFYAAAILLVAGGAALISSFLVLGWGLSCFWRWGQLQKLINTAVREAGDK